MHGFPLDNDELLRKWLKNVSRENIVPTVNCRVCSLHFQEGDFKQDRLDSNAWMEKEVQKTVGSAKT